jgi:MarR family transcriptional regulator, organic hydroperoxide resistance regulator
VASFDYQRPYYKIPYDWVNATQIDFQGQRVTATIRKLEKRERTGPTRDVPDIGLGMLLRDANATFNRVLREELARHDITFSQYQHLRQLWQADGSAQVELSRRIGIETASSTSVIDQLEKLGLIRRQRDAGDRRRIIVTLTPAGRALEKPLDGGAMVVNMRARAGLSKAEVAALFDSIGKIIDNLGGKSRRP